MKHTNGAKTITGSPLRSPLAAIKVSRQREKRLHRKNTKQTNNQTNKQANKQTNKQMVQKLLLGHH